MRVLVTGGRGFLGSGICRALIARGHQVRSLARGPSPELTRLGIECWTGDISRLADVEQAVAGCAVVFHVAAKAGVWGPEADYHATNVVGTANVVAACQAAGVPRLIYTSSPSVVYSGGDEAGLDETAPYPERYLTAYPRTKALAERAVLAANSPALATVALRPHLIWGPGDNHLFPRLVDRARRGRLRRVGPGTNRVDATYIDNAVAAHLAALDRLQWGAACAGRAYFIANDEPLLLWDLIDRLLACAGEPPVTKGISATAAVTVGAVLETVYRVCGWEAEPPMTQFVARQLSTDHWYDLTAAKRDLGYVATVSTATGLERLREWWITSHRAASVPAT